VQVPELASATQGEGHNCKKGGRASQRASQCAAKYAYGAGAGAGKCLSKERVTIAKREVGGLIKGMATFSSSINGGDVGPKK